MLKIYFLIYFALILPLFSCSQFNENDLKFSNNEVFQQKYGDEIAQINIDRTPQDPQNENGYFSPIDQNSPNNDKANSFDYVGISYFDTQKTQKIFPDIETYELGINSNPDKGLPPKIFEIGYNMFLNPPFSKDGEEFDYIEIPEKDNFGIKSSSEDKNYTLVPIQSIQYAVNEINKSRSQEDIEFSKKIILEKKLLLRKKNLQKFQEKSQYAKLFEESFLKTDTAITKNN